MSTIASTAADVLTILDAAGIERAWLFGSSEGGPALVASWGGPADIETFAPPLQHDTWTRGWWARLLRHAATPASLRAVLTGLRDADVRERLPQVACATLVMHRRGDRAVWFQAGEHLAAKIRGARFVPMEGDCHWWWVQDPGAVADAVLDFAS